MKFCPRCGSRNQDSATTCASCGKPLPGAAAAKTAPADAASPSHSASGSPSSHGGPAPSGSPSSHRPPASHGVSRESKARESVRPAGSKSAAPSSGSILAWLSRFFGNKRTAEVDVPSLFSSVFKKHSAEEAEEIFICGTATTTPSPSSVASSWPRPWLFSRVFLVFAMTYLLLFCCLAAFDNALVIPNLMVVGSFAMPIALLVFFIELNVWRNISMYRVLQVFAVGGAASLVITMVINAAFTVQLVDARGQMTWAGAFLAGIGEEVAKALIVLIAMRLFLKTPQRLLNGLVIGAAVGAGFGAFEAAGYSFIFFNGAGQGDPVKSMNMIILIRGVLAPGGHAAYAALHGAAFSIAARSVKLDLSAMGTPQYLKIGLTSAIFHVIWDAPIVEAGNQLMEFGKYAILILVMWTVVLVLVHRGLDEVRHVYSRPVKP